MNRARRILIALLLPLAFAGMGSVQKPDAKGIKDHPLLTRMRNYYIYSYSGLEFDQVDVRVENKTISVEGRRYEIRCALNDGINPPSQMRQDVQAKPTEWMADVSAAGHAAVYGIHFDVDKAVVKPESAPGLQEIAALLRKNLKLNVHLVGHTDSTGPFDNNLKLSEARATAVVNTLVTQYNIATARLKASRVGQLSPVASNRTEEGRARNRRVELVEQQSLVEETYAYLIPC